MMKRLSGFTVAEVLVTLGLVGVVAALTLPALNSSIRGQQIGPAFAKAVNTLENGNKLLMNENEVRKLSDIEADNYLDALSSTVNLTSAPSGVEYTAFTGSTTVFTSPATSYQTGDGVAYYLSGGLTNGGSTEGAYMGSYYTLYIDINGPATSPNAMGRDLFKVYVDTSGTVIPHGGSAYASYMPSGSSEWASDCKGKTVGGSPAGVSCAGSIADNNWKAVYKL